MSYKNKISRLSYFILSFSQWSHSLWVLCFKKDHPERLSNTVWCAAVISWNTVPVKTKNWARRKTMEVVKALNKLASKTSVFFYTCCFFWRGTGFLVLDFMYWTHSGYLCLLDTTLQWYFVIYSFRNKFFWQLSAFMCQCTHFSSSSWLFVVVTDSLKTSQGQAKVKKIPSVSKIMSLSFGDLLKNSQSAFNQVTNASYIIRFKPSWLKLFSHKS